MIGNTTVFDCFPYYDETDILEIRLHELYDVVDYFVISEANTSWCGTPKPYNFESCLNSDNFAFAKSKIVYIKTNFPFNGDYWSSEKNQRNALLEGVVSKINNDTDDYIISLSDLDEIPAKDKFKDACLKVQETNDHVGILLQNMHFYFNVFIANLRRCGPVLCRKNNYINMQHMRNHRDVLSHYTDGGWHLSWMGGAESIQHEFDFHAPGEHIIEERYRDLNSAINNYHTDFAPFITGDHRPPVSDYIYKLYPFNSSMSPQYVIDNLHVFNKYIYKYPQKININYWQHISDFFSPTTEYTQFINNLQDNNSVVVIGDKKAKATCYIAIQTKQYNKNISIDSIVHFDTNEMLDSFICNIRECGVEDVVTLIHKDTHQSAMLYTDKTLDILVIKIDKSTSILNIIELWYPKIKNGGMLVCYSTELTELQSDILSIFFNQSTQNTNLIQWYTKRVNN